MLGWQVPHSTAHQEKEAAHHHPSCARTLLCTTAPETGTGKQVPCFSRAWGLNLGNNTREWKQITWE